MIAFTSRYYIFYFTDEEIKAEGPWANMPNVTKSIHGGVLIQNQGAHPASFFSILG